MREHKANTTLESKLYKIKMIASSQAGSGVKATYRPRRAPPTAHKHLPNYPTRLNSIASETGSTGLIQ